MRTIIKFALTFSGETFPVTANVPTALFFDDYGRLNIRKLESWLHAATVVCEPTTIDGEPVKPGISELR